MKTIVFSFLLAFSFTIDIAAQNQLEDVKDPVAFLVGDWVQKTTSISPAPASDDWKDETTINEFTAIMQGRGLMRIAYNDDSYHEGYMFYDMGSHKFIGMSVDENGYVWQSHSILNSAGKITGNSGEAVSDPKARFETEIEVKNKSEIHFKQYIYDGDKLIQTIEGFLIRIG